MSYEGMVLDKKRNKKCWDGNEDILSSARVKIYHIYIFL